MKEKILDLGCGKNKYPRAIGIDFIKTEAVDVVHDLNQFPYPFKDNEFDMVVCRGILFILNDVRRVLMELHRITKNNGLIKISEPHFTTPHSDILQARTFGWSSFKNFIDGYTDWYVKGFEIKKEKLVFAKPYKILEIIFNKIPIIYEDFFCFIFPCRRIEVELIVKN